MTVEELIKTMNCNRLQDIAQSERAAEITLQTIKWRKPTSGLLRLCSISMLYCPQCGKRTKLGDSLPKDAYYD